MKIALVGDHSPDVVAHRAIPIALQLAADSAGRGVESCWVATRDVRDAPAELAGFSAVWLAPASPYENMAGALAAIRFARETRRPFLGTCGGFQHALIEFARHVAGVHDADHAETNPAAAALLIAPMSCSLAGARGELRCVPGSILHTAYCRDLVTEEYNCSYGPNPAYRAALESAGLRFTAFDANGAIRAAELPQAIHPFFVGTLFQPERAALRGELPPLVRAFVGAIA